MPQYPLNINARTPAGTFQFYKLDAAGNLIVADNQGDEQSQLNVTVGSVIHAGAAVAGKVTVITAGTVAGSVNDTATVSLAGSANAIYTIPTVAGAPVTLDWPVTTGLVINPGGGVIAITWRNP